MTDQQGLDKQESDLESGSDCYEPVTTVRTNGDPGSLICSSDRSVDFHSSLSHIFLCWYISLCKKYPENSTGLKKKIKKIFGNVLELGQFSEKLIAGNDESGMELRNYVDRFHCEHSHKANLKNVLDDKSGEKWTNIPAFRAAQEVYVYKTPLLKPLHADYMAWICVMPSKKQTNKELSRIPQQSFLFERRVLLSEDQRNFVVFPAHFNRQNNESANIENRIISHNNLSNTDSSNNEERQPGNNHGGRTDDTTMTERPQVESINGNHNQTESPHEESENGVIYTESPHEESENGVIYTASPHEESENGVIYIGTPHEESENCIIFTESPHEESENGVIYTESPHEESENGVIYTESPHQESENCIIYRESPHQESENDIIYIENPHEESENCVIFTESPHEESENGVIYIGTPHEESENCIIFTESPHEESKNCIIFTESPHEESENGVIYRESPHEESVNGIIYQPTENNIKGETPPQEFVNDFQQKTDNTENTNSTDIPLGESKEDSHKQPKHDILPEVSINDTKKKMARMLDTNNEINMIDTEVRRTDKDIQHQLPKNQSENDFHEQIGINIRKDTSQEDFNNTLGQTGDVTMIFSLQEKTVKGHPKLDTNNIVNAQEVSVGKTQRQTDDVNMIHSPLEKTEKDHTNNKVIAQEVSLSEIQGQTDDVTMIEAPHQKTVKDHTNNIVIAQEETVGETQGQTGDVTMIDSPQEKTVKDHTNNTVIAQEVSVSETQGQTGDVTMIEAPHQKTVKDHTNNIVIAQEETVGETEGQTGDVTMIDSPQEKTVKDHTNNTVIAQEVSLSETQGQTGDVTMIDSPQEKTVKDHTNNTVIAQEETVGETQGQTGDVTMIEAPNKKTVKDHTNNTVIAQEVSLSETQGQTGDVTTIKDPNKKTVKDHTNNIVIAQEETVGETQGQTGDVTMIEAPHQKSERDHTNNTVIAQEVSLSETQGQTGDVTMIEALHQKTERDHTYNTVIAQEVSLTETLRQASDITLPGSKQEETIFSSTHEETTFTQLEFSQTDHLDCHDLYNTLEDSVLFDDENLSREDKENGYEYDASETCLKQVYTADLNSMYIFTDEGCFCPDLDGNCGPESTLHCPSCEPLSGHDDIGYHSRDELENEEQTYPKEFNISPQENLLGIFPNTTTEDNASNTFIPDNQNDVLNTYVAKPMQNNTAASQCTEQPTIQSNSDRQRDSDMLEGLAMVTASQEDSEKYIHQTNVCLQRRQNTISPLQIQHTQHNNHLEDNSRECISGQNVSPMSASIDVNSSSCTTDVVRWDPRQMNHITQSDMEDRQSMNQFSSANVESYGTPFPEDIPTFGRTNPDRTPSSNPDDTMFDFLQMRQTFLSTSVTPDTPGYESAHHTSSRTGSESPMGRYPVVQHGNAASWKQDVSPSSGFTVKILHSGKVLTELKLYAPIRKDELNNRLSRDVWVQELLRQYPGHIGYSLRDLGRRPDTTVDRDSVFELVIEF